MVGFFTSLVDAFCSSFGLPSAADVGVRVVVAMMSLSANVDLTDS